MLNIFLNKSLKTKLVIVNMLVLFIIGIFIFFFVSSRQEKRALINKYNKAKSMGSILSHTVGTTLELFFLGLAEDDDLEESLESVIKDKEFFYVEILDLDGNRVKYIKKDLAEKRTITVSYPIYSSSREEIGIVNLGLHLIYVYKELQVEYMIIVSVLLVTYLCAFLAIVGISHLLIYPLKKLERVTNTFSLGKLSSRVSIQNQDEIGRLGETFNRMADKLEDYTKNLERMVEEKTAQLHKTQEQLIKMARDMGMAELAISVLHNIGNAVTPLIIRITNLLEQFRSKDFLFLSQLNELMAIQKKYKDRDKSLIKFYTKNPKGKKIPEFIELFAKFLSKQKELLEGEMEKLYTYSRHIEDIIRLQMNYAKITDETHQIYMESFVDDALLMQQNSIEKRNIKVVKSYEPDLVIFANRTKFMQILQNLIKNAYEAIELTSNHLKEIRVKTEYIRGRREDMVRFVIEDTGIGMEPAQVQKVFEYGYTTKKQGTGFGLHSCENFINALNGKIFCYSEGINKGSRFVIDIPGKINS